MFWFWHRKPERRLMFEILAVLQEESPLTADQVATELLFAEGWGTAASGAAVRRALRWMERLGMVKSERCQWLEAKHEKKELSKPRRFWLAGRERAYRPTVTRDQFFIREGDYYDDLS